MGCRQLNRVGDEGACALAEALLSNSRLQRLGLSANRLSSQVRGRCSSALAWDYGPIHVSEPVRLLCCALLHGCSAGGPRRALTSWVVASLLCALLGDIRLALRVQPHIILPVVRRRLRLAGCCAATPACWPWTCLAMPWGQPELRSCSPPCRTTGVQWRFLAPVRDTARRAKCSVKRAVDLFSLLWCPASGCFTEAGHNRAC